MQILITGIAGFVGSTIAIGLRERCPTASITGIDNFIRPGSERNCQTLRDLDITVTEGDIRNRDDLESLGAADTVIDAAALPSAAGGTDGQTTSREIVDINLLGTVNLLEYCKQQQARFILLSTSRVYSIGAIRAIQMECLEDAFSPLPDQIFPQGATPNGLSENFSTAAPISLYGATKLASETLALEYGNQFDFPVWINRCGVLAGAGQFGRSDQGIFAYWINSYLRKRPLKYTGFEGRGNQARDCLHPKDLVPLLLKQAQTSSTDRIQICNFGGGIKNSMSLAQLSRWCSERCDPVEVQSDPMTRSWDIPWMVMDNRRAKKVWDWAPITPLDKILDEILAHARANPDWLEISTGDLSETPESNCV